MPDPLEFWRGLSRPWKTFVVVFVVALIFMSARGILAVSPVFALFSAVLWAAAAASIVRMRDRLRPPGS